MNARNFVFAVKIFRIASVKKRNEKQAKEITGPHSEAALVCVCTSQRKCKL